MSIDNKNEEIFIGRPIALNIHKVDDNISFSNGKTGCVIYYTITNNGKKKVKVNIHETYIINPKGEQREKDHYLDGYSFSHGEIASGAHKICGDIFLVNTAGALSSDWRFAVDLDDETNGSKYYIVFRLIDMIKHEWIIETSEITSIEKTITPKELSKRLKERVERIDAFEAKIGIRIDNISVQVGERLGNLSVLGDLFLQNSDTLKTDVLIIASLYNCNNEVIEADSTRISAEHFMGFESFKIDLYTDVREVSHIRLYPKIG